MRVLIVCEFSGVVRRAFRSLGHDAWSCDILPAEDGDCQHYQEDVLGILGYGWDLMIAHPPCTHLCTRGAWHSRRRGKPEQIEDAKSFVLSLYNSPIPKVCIENPIGVLNTQWRRPNQIINPFDFGHRERKATCLWLKGLPPLFLTGQRAPQEPTFRDSTTGKRRYFVDAMSGSRNRALNRARTFPGIASAMAKQWGSLKPIYA